MQVGDLVRITRASIGVPKGSIGLVLSCSTHGNKYDHGLGDCTWEIKLSGCRRKYPRRYLEMDLEVVSASR